MKKINVITKYFYPVKGGIELSVLETYSRLTKQEFDITIHASSDSYVKKNVYKKSEKIKGLEVKRYKSGIFGIFPLIDFKNTDYLILHNFNIFPHFRLLLVTLIKKILCVKNYVLIVSPHGGMTPNYANLKLTESLIKKLVNKLMILVANKTVDVVRVVSEWERDNVKKVGIDINKIKLIYDGIEDQAYKPNKQVSKSTKDFLKDLGTYVIQIGKVHKTKKYETAIKALAKYERGKDVKLVIVGKPVDRRYFDGLKNLVKRVNLTKKVIFINKVDVNDKYYLLNKAKLFILTSDWESFGRICYEALSQGLFVLVSDKAAPTHLIRENKISGAIFNNLDSNQLAKLISREIKKGKSEKNKIYSKKFAWKSVAHEYEKMLRGV